MKKAVILVPVAVLVAGYLMMQLLTSFKKDPQKRTPPPRPKIVQAELGILHDIQTEIVAYGRLTSAQPVIMYSEVAGYLEKGTIPFQPAQSFRKGDLLLKIDDRQIRLDLNSTKSDLLTALASILPEFRVDFPLEYQTWQDYFNQIKFDEKVPSLPETSDQKIKLFLSRFNVYKLYFAVKNQEILLEKHFLYAPFNGSIVATDLRAGSSVRSGTRLGEIINLDNLEVEVPVQAQDVKWIDSQKPVTLTSAELSGEWQGRVKRIGQNINERTQTIQVFITLNQSQHDQLYNGVFLKAAIPGKVIKHAMRVAQKAIYDQTYVYLIQNGRFDFRKVDIARKETDSSIVSAGIQEGDTLVVEVMQGVAPGMLAQANIVPTNGRAEQ
jgi:multidrug efflux pump subunit AcrA (membrane-fusion protein)